MSYSNFSAVDAHELVLEAKQGTFLSKGKVIDIIRSAAKKGETSVNVVGLPEEVATSLTENGFQVKEETIFWLPNTQG